MNQSEKVFDLAKRLVALQEELNEYQVDTEPLVKLIEDVSHKAVSYAKKEIRGFGEGAFLKSDLFELNEENKLRWQKLAGIKPQPVAQRLKEFADRIDDETRALAFALRVQTKDNTVRAIEGLIADSAKIDYTSNAKEVAKAAVGSAIHEPAVCYEALAGSDQSSPPHYVDVENLSVKVSKAFDKFNQEKIKKDE